MRAGVGRWAVACVVVLALVCAALAPSIRFPYVWDAGPAVRNNALVQRGSPIEILTSDYWRGTGLSDRTLYRPVTVASFALERWTLGGSDPRVSHLVNLLLHAVTALLLMLWVRRLGGRDDTALVAGALFACHPLLLLTAVNVVGRADILATGFSLAALWCLGGSRPRRLAAWGAAGLLLLALGSKEVALATPALLVVQELLRAAPARERAAGARWIERCAALAPCGLALSSFVCLRTTAIEVFPGVQSPAPMDNILVGMHGIPRVATVLALAARYGKLLLLPQPMSADYSGTAIPPATSLLAPGPIAGLLFLGLLVVLAVSPRVTSRLVRLSAALFLFPYLLVGNLVVLNGAGFAERLIYFSATGFCVLVATGLLALAHALRIRRVATVVALAALLLAGVLVARAESLAWRSDEALLEATLRATPRSLRAHFALAELRSGQRRDDEALRLYDEALRLWPTHEASWLYRGVLLARRGDLAEGERCARQALALQPDFGEARAFLGIVLKHEARYEQAERELRKALLSRPPILDARAELGLLLLERGRYAEAVGFLRECVAHGMLALQPQLEEAQRRSQRG